MKFFKISFESLWKTRQFYGYFNCGKLAWEREIFLLNLKRIARNFIFWCDVEVECYHRVKLKFYLLRLSTENLAVCVVWKKYYKYLVPPRFFCTDAKKGWRFAIWQEFLGSFFFMRLKNPLRLWETHALSSCHFCYFVK